MSSSRNRRRVLTAVVTAGVAGSALFVGTGIGNAAVVAPVAKSASASLVSASGGAVSITGTGFRNATGAYVVTAASLVVATSGTAAAPACSGSGTAATTFSNLSATKVSVTLPNVAATLTGFTTPASSAKAAICLAYVDTTTKYVAVPVVVALQPVKNGSTPLAPVTGLLVGGQTITLATTSTTAWPAGSTVLVGGVAATGVKIAKDGQSLTAVTPAGATAGAKTVIVRAPGFADVTLTNAYTYVNGITISPASGVPSASQTTPIDITGSGFMGAAYTALNVYLWNGDSAVDQNATPCASVQVISDSELTCEVPATSAATVFQVYVSQIAQTTGSWDATKVTALSTTSVFTVADF